MHTKFRLASRHRQPRSFDIPAWFFQYLRELRCAPNGAITSWVQVPPGQWPVGPVAIRRLGWVTNLVEALRQRPLLAVERIDGP